MNDTKLTKTLQAISPVAQQMVIYSSCMVDNKSDTQSPISEYQFQEKWYRVQN